MSRKSRKTNTDVQKTFMKPITVGYVRLSVSKKENNHSIENKKLIIMGRTAENDYFSFLR